MTKNNNSYFICIYNLIKNSILDLYISFIKNPKQKFFIFLLSCTLLFVSITQIINKISGVRDDKIIKVIQWLMENDKLISNEENLLEWRK